MTDATLQHAARILRDGGVVAFPTETVYGLGADALNPMAVARIFEIKGRPRFDPLIVHVASLDQTHKLWHMFPETAEKLVRRFWPGPLTIVLPRRPEVPDIVTAGLETVAVRMPAHPMALELIRQAGVPIAAPSANSFGRISPTTAQHVQQDLGNAVDLILDGGRCTTGVESTVLSLAGGEPLLLRHGGVAVEEIEAVIGPVTRATDSQKRPMAPGQLPQHYAPRIPLHLHEPGFWHGDPSALASRRQRGLMLLRPADGDTGYQQVEVLSPSGDLREAAANLFAAMHRLDQAGLSAIDAERVPDEGLGRAINDRLQRASQR